VVVATGAVAWTSVRPRGDRVWIPEQAVMAEAIVDGRTARVHNLRNFSYRGRRVFKEGYADRTYDLDKLNSVWYVLTPFDEGWRGPAHSFVSFGFADSQFVSISVEARREPGETYDAIKGLFKRFELMYVVGDERDLVGQRAVFSDDRVYLYPIKTSPERMRAMFVGMLERANELRERPEFYNTLTNNCTSNVVAHVNRIVPDAVPAGFKTMLPGYTDEVAMTLGLIDTDLGIAAARERFLVNERAKKYFGDPAFSLRIRELDSTSSRH
jgi:hypothetical protein